MGLVGGFLNARPTTAYMLTYLAGRCTANCGFCSQARGSRTRADMLSRVAWPVFPTRRVMPKLAVAVEKGEIRRVCLQALNYPNVFEDLLTLVKKIRLLAVDVPISVSCQPLKRKEMKELAEAGVERMGIALDGATEKVFNSVKGKAAQGPYDWNRHRLALLEALTVFGKGKVSTHLIVGLGETEEDVLEAIQWCIDKNICPALFSFTPLPGTALERVDSPAIEQYRRIQLARHLMISGRTRFEEMGFEENGQIRNFGVSHDTLKTTLRTGKPFVTSGCPNCNRPYYNEKPSGPIYNFPEQPTSHEIAEIEKQLKR